ncbi:MAG TPA: sterol desaturase family protein [Myxococcaceae bacterium]|nr:sterol desaturase family protein [Myxococcaceae bacterium]
MLTTYVVLGASVLMFISELVATRQEWTRVEGWWQRAIALNAFGFLTVFITGSALRGALSSHRLFRGERLGVVGGAVVGYLVMSFVNYWWHRLRHRSPFFWRWFHQLHHSAQRIELATTFYKHPIESIVDTLGAMVILYGVVGVSPAAAAGAMMMAGLLELFFHWNVKTPAWVGYIIQRPEAHCVHHEAGIHAYNYSDISLWDILFGTFKNPETWDGVCGLGYENELRLGEMLRGVDVTETPPEPPMTPPLRPLPQRVAA